MFLHVLSFKFLNSGLGKQNAVNGKVAEDSSVPFALNIFKIALFIYYVCSQIFALFPKNMLHIFML
jgi:hypothetical protein